MSTFMIIIIGLGFFGIGAIFFLFGVRWVSTDDISSRLEEFVLEQSLDAQRFSLDWRSQSRELRGSLISRIVLPSVHRLGKFLGRLTPVSVIDDIARQLLIAGNPLNLGAREFFGLRLAFDLFGIVIVFLILRQRFDRLYILMSILMLISCYFIPTLWLRSRVRTRQNLIRKGLPDAMDMLSVCATAGLGFDQSLQRVSEYWNTPIGLEFGRVVAEMEMGLSRSEALRNLADRLEVNELSSFVAFVLSAIVVFRIGLAFGEILKMSDVDRRS